MALLMKERFVKMLTSFVKMIEINCHKGKAGHGEFLPSHKRIRRIAQDQAYKQVCKFIPPSHSLLQGPNSFMYFIKKLRDLSMKTYRFNAALGRKQENLWISVRAMIYTGINSEFYYGGWWRRRH